MTNLTIQALKHNNEVGKIVVNCEKVDEAMLMEVYRKILLQIPVKGKENGKHIIFELTSEFCLENLQFSQFDFFIRQLWSKSDKFLVIYEYKYFVKNILGKASLVRKDKK